MKIKACIMDISRNNSWYVKYSVFFSNGETETKTVSTKVSKREKTKTWMKRVFLPLWIEKMQEKLEKEAKQVYLFEHFADKFLAAYEKEWHDYQNVFYRTRRICNDFGKRPLTEITKLEIKEYLQNLTSTKDGHSLLSGNSKKKYLSIFHGVFELALDANLIERNFTYDIRINARVEEKGVDNSVLPFSKKEVKLLLEESKKKELYGTHIHPYLGIAFNMGMSASEIIGLQIGDIDKKELMVSISRNLTKGKVKETKTVYRNRMLPIMKGALPYFEFLLEESIRKSSLWLFSNEDGTPLYDIKSIRGSREIRARQTGTTTKRLSGWYLLLHNLDISYRDIKNCRHTFAVNGLEGGDFTMQEMANFLGHGSLQMIFKHYAKSVSNKAVSVNTAVDLYRAK